MGKGDKRSRRGKIFAGSYGKTRQKPKHAAFVPTDKPVVAAESAVKEKPKPKVRKKAAIAEEPAPEILAETAPEVAVEPAQPEAAEVSAETSEATPEPEAAAPDMANDAKTEAAGE